MLSLPLLVFLELLYYHLQLLILLYLQLKMTVWIVQVLASDMEMIIPVSTNNE